MSKPNKNTKQLEQALICIYLSGNETALARLIQTRLPPLCHVENITLELNAPKPRRRKKSYSYVHFCSQNTRSYFIKFYNSDGIKSEQKIFLKKIALALESQMNRLERQNRLKNKKEQWELAFDTIAVPICLIDQHKRILRTNKTFRAQTKQSKTSLLQKNCFQSFFGSQEESILLADDLSRTGGKKRIKRTTHNKEEVFEVSVHSISKLKDMQIVIFRDMTEQIKLEKKLARMAQDAELGIISSSIAHELSNPIAGMNALLQLLQAKHQNNKKLAADLNQMALAGERCVHIIHQLLNITPRREKIF